MLSVARTCGPRDRYYANVLAVDPAIPDLHGDWLAPEPANYAVMKAAWRGGMPLLCSFEYAGGGFFGAPPAEAWRRIASGRTRFLITVDPAIHQIPSLVFNESLSREGFPILMEKVNGSGLFVREPPLAADAGIVIYRRTNRDVLAPAELERAAGAK